jgi:hypothetical protein
VVIPDLNASDLSLPAYVVRKESVLDNAWKALDPCHMEHAGRHWTGHHSMMPCQSASHSATPYRTTWVGEADEIAANSSARRTC